MNKNRSWIDANIILHFLLKDDEKLFEASFNLFEQAEKGDLVLHIHPLTVAEVIWTLESFYGYEKNEIAAVFGGLLESEGLQVESLEVVRKAIGDYVGENVDFIDAFLAAYAALIGPAAIYTFDKKHLSKLEGDL
ncbi:MAG: PIN domain-containing protein [Bacillota bacterium]|nr:PIN domain-containing protein [Bacillota bacterium]